MRRQLGKIATTFLVLVLATGAATPTRAQALYESVLYHFCSVSACADGLGPVAGVILDSKGNLYGTTPYGGDVGSACVLPHGCGYGLVFELSPPTSGSGLWTETVLHRFTGYPGDGDYPLASLIMDNAGNLYGTTASGGSHNYGVVFELNPPSSGSGPWTETVLYSFTGGSDGGIPNAGLIFDSYGRLYGTTFGGGDVSACPATQASGPGCGVVFGLSPPRNGIGSWTETPLHTFTGGSDGGYPVASLIFDSKGSLYGTTLGGGDTSACPTVVSTTPPGCGVVFELILPTGSGQWSESVLYTFTGGSHGAWPHGGLIFDSNGNLYSTTAGGNYGAGVAFALSPPSSGTGPWTETVLHTFMGAGGVTNDGVEPEAGLIFDARGNLYGTTVVGGCSSCPYGGSGMVFELSPPSSGSGPWTETVLVSFTGANGAYPTAGVIFDSKGNLYGTTNGQAGGGPTSGSLVFELSPSQQVTKPRKRLVQVTSE